MNDEKKYIVSACLIGNNCKYNGGNNRNEKVVSFLKDKVIIPVCPEMKAGFGVPRPKTELGGNGGEDVVNGNAVVLNEFGVDVTSQFIEGARDEFKSLPPETEIDFAILKARSPSCGANEIYDGSFSGKLKNGDGVFAYLLREKDIRIRTEEYFKNQ